MNRYGRIFFKNVWLVFEKSKYSNLESNVIYGTEIVTIIIYDQIFENIAETIKEKMYETSS